MLNSDEMLLRALTDALVERKRQEAEQWTVERELLATLTETVHALLIVTLKVNGAKSVGKPLRIPRPNDGESTQPAVSMREFVAMNG